MDQHGRFLVMPSVTCLAPDPASCPREHRRAELQAKGRLRSGSFTGSFVKGFMAILEPWVLQFGIG